VVSRRNEGRTNKTKSQKQNDEKQHRQDNHEDEHGPTRCRVLVLLDEAVHFSLGARELGGGVVNAVVEVFEHAVRVMGGEGVRQSLVRSRKSLPHHSFREAPSEGKQHEGEGRTRFARALPDP
jgi:hypothetical protein